MSSTQLDKYVGRIVRLNQQVFEGILRRARNPSADLDNCFLVAAISREMGKLICYGADTRIAVGAADVALI